MLDSNWLDRLDNERRLKNIPSDQARVLVEVWKLVMSGDDMPSEARLADMAGTSKRTVSRAKATGRTLGLIGWERQWAVVDGLRREQPCAYRVEMPATPCVRRERQSGIRTVPRTFSQQLALIGPPPPNAAALTAARQAQLNAEWLAARQVSRVRLRV